MGAINSFGSTLAWPLLWPGDFTCRAIGFNEAEARDLVRMLVNSLRIAESLKISLFYRPDRPWAARPT